MYLGELRLAPPDEYFSQSQLKRGALVELEHTTDYETAKLIAKHHLLEDPLYYEKLAEIEPHHG